MTANAPSVVVPVVPFTRRAPVGARWPAAQRAALEARLAALGTGITEISDAREHLGLERLSDATPEQRAAAHYLTMSSKGRAAIKAVRELRALLTEGLASCERLAVARARALLDIRRAPSQLRLGELSALYAQARLIEIAREP